MRLEETTHKKLISSPKPYDKLQVGQRGRSKDSHKNIRPTEGKMKLLKAQTQDKTG